MQTIWLATFIVLTTSCGISPQGHQHRSGQAAGPDQTEVASSSADADQGLGFRQAFLTHVHPVLKENCATCHSDGTHPFASADSQKAADAAGRYIGVNKESSRLFQKIANEDHPTKEIATKVRSSIETALEDFFEAVDQATLGGVKFITKFKAIKDAKTTIPTITNRGILLVELEGTEVNDESGKMFVKPGAYSNSLGLESRIVPANPNTGAARSYDSRICVSSTPAISEAAHVKNGQGEGIILKQSYLLNATIYDPSDDEVFLELGKEITISPIRILPMNADPQTNWSDSIYSSSAPDPQTVNWRHDQLRHILGAIEHDILKPRLAKPTKFARAITLLEELKTAADANPSAVLNYLTNLSFTTESGPRVIKTQSYNRTTEALEDIHSFVDIHKNQPVDLQTLDPQFYTPGIARFTFKTPTSFSFDAGEVVPFRLYTQIDGPFRFRLRDASGSIIKLGNTSCASLNGGTGWRGHGIRLNLKRDETYTAEFLQVDQTTKMDAAMLVSESEEIGDADVDTRLLYTPTYGEAGTGNQESVKVLTYETPIGRVSVEVFDNGASYSLQAIRFYSTGSNSGKNILVDGTLAFFIRGKDKVTNIALSTKSFKFDNDVRKSGDVAHYGKAVFPRLDGGKIDEIAIGFAKIEATGAKAEIPRYKDSPPEPEENCLALAEFEKNVMPLYTQQRLMLRQRYDNWLQDEYPVSTNNMVPTPTPQTYTCTSCHDDEHPLLRMYNDPVKLCREILARTNKSNVALSFSLRGLMAWFGHPYLYPVFDPFSGSSMRKVRSDGRDLIYGPTLGRFATRSKSKMDMEIANNPQETDILYRFLQYPADTGMDQDPKTGEPVQDMSNMWITYPDALPGEYPLHTMTRRTSGGNIETQTDSIRSKWLYRFRKWVEAENRAAK